MVYPKCPWFILIFSNPTVNLGVQFLGKPKYLVVGHIYIYTYIYILIYTYYICIYIYIYPKQSSHSFPIAFHHCPFHLPRCTAPPPASCRTPRSSAWSCRSRTSPPRMMAITWRGNGGFPEVGDARNGRCLLCNTVKIPSGNLTSPWKITIFNGKTHYKWSFSIAMLNYQRVCFAVCCLMIVFEIERRPVFFRDNMFWNVLNKIVLCIIFCNI